jgi:hypothetical protein
LVRKLALRVMLIPFNIAGKLIYDKRKLRLLL